MESNVQIVQRAFQEFMRGNTAAVVDICSDDVTWGGFDNPGVPLAGTFKGKTGVKRFFSQVAELIDYFSFTPREYLGNGETVIVLGHNAGKVKTTGKTFDQDWAMVFRLRESKIYSFFNFVDTRQTAEVFQQGFDLQRKETIPATGVKANK